jgi:N-acetylmuramoyl-L-alanine amidase
MNSRPLRFAEIAVLKSADIPSVLIEVGFMSNDQDLADLQNEEVRKRIVAGILQGVLLWSIEDAEFAKRVRQ